MAEIVKEIRVTISAPQHAVLTSRQQFILEMAGQGGGKSQNIGFASGQKIQDFPRAKGFIGANTDKQLAQSTLDRVYRVWDSVYGYTQYDAKKNPEGDFVVDRRPPIHFEQFYQFKDYANIASFKNGAVVFLGSLTNYKAHDGKEFAWAHLDETKDTSEKALKDVILGRLRQYGLWFRPDGEIVFDEKISAEKALADGLKPWNPLYVHTSPPEDGVPWLNEMFKLFSYEKEIYARVTQKDADFFNKTFDMHHAVIYPADHNKKNLPPGFLHRQRTALGPKKSLKLVDGFPFGASGGEFYPDFDRHNHTGVVPRLDNAAIQQGWDFNVIPYMTLICAQLEDVYRYIDESGVKYDDPIEGTKPLMVTRVRVYKEYCMEPPLNTNSGVCEAFKEDHDAMNTEVILRGDHNGKNRIPGLGAFTNYKEVEEILWQYLHNDSMQVKPNVGVMKRRDLVNDIFRGKYPEIEIIIDLENCPKLVNDLTFVKQGKDGGKFKQYVEDPNTHEKYQSLGHPGDCLEYILCGLFPEYLKK